MKKIILIIFLLPIFTLAQDNIVLKNGEDINAKILEINESVIKYKKYDNQEGPIYTILKNEIFFIKYPNGDKDIFSNINSISNDRSDKKILLSGGSAFLYQNSFENDYFNSSTNFSISSGIGAFLSKNFVIGASLAISSSNTNNTSSTLTVFGPFMRGYINNFYSEAAIALSEDVNVASLALGYQINLTNSISLNPNFIYYNRYYNEDIYGPDIWQMGILIGCAFELHL